MSCPVKLTRNAERMIDLSHSREATRSVQLSTTQKRILADADSVLRDAKKISIICKRELADAPRVIAEAYRVIDEVKKMPISAQRKAGADRALIVKADPVLVEAKRAHRDAGKVLQEGSAQHIQRTSLLASHQQSPKPSIISPHSSPDAALEDVPAVSKRLSIALPLQTRHSELLAKRFERQDPSTQPRDRKSLPILKEGSQSKQRVIKQKPELQHSSLEAVVQGLSAVSRRLSIALPHQTRHSELLAKRFEKKDPPSQP